MSSINSLLYKTNKIQQVSMLKYFQNYSKIKIKTGGKKNILVLQSVKLVEIYVNMLI